MAKSDCGDFGCYGVFVNKTEMYQAMFWFVFSRKNIGALVSVDKEIERFGKITGIPEGAISIDTAKAKYNSLQTEFYEMRELTAKQERFCREYLVDLNATQAAIRAKYSKKTAYSIGEENLKKPEIARRIKELQYKVANKLDISIEWVARRFKEISDRCMTAEPVMIMVDGELVESGEYKFDSSGSNKATEMLGKHLGFFEKDNGQKQPINLLGSTEFKITRRKK